MFEKRKSIKVTIIVLLILFLITYGMGIVLTMIRRTNKGFKKYLTGSVEAKGFAFQAELGATCEDLLKATDTIASSIEHFPVVLEMLQSGDANVMADYLSSHLESTGASEVFVLDSNGSIIYTATKKRYNPAVFLSNGSFKAVASSQAKKAAHLAKVEDRLSFVAVNKAGGFYIVFEKPFSTAEVIDYYSQTFASVLTLFEDDVRIVSSLKDERGNRLLVGTKLDNNAIYNAVYRERRPYFGEENIVGQQYMTAYVPIDTGDVNDKYILFIGESTATFSTVMGEAQRVATLYTFIFTAFQITIFVFILQRLIFKPLGKVGKAMKRLSEDTGDTDLTYRLNIGLDNELGVLCNDVDEFIGRVQGLIVDMKSAQNSLLGIGDNLGEASERSASSIHSIMANIDNIREQTVQQAAAMDSASTAVERNASDVDRLDDLIENQSAGLAESSASIEKMVDNIEAVSGNIQKMSGQFKELVKLTEAGQGTQAEVHAKVNEMAEQSQLLMQANSVIASIASKTNLLAMNAAIEAAHAGESGKGFSVVADEIRSLAANSSKQSVSISNQLDQILKTITEVVNASESSKKAFATITSKLTDTDSLVREIDSAIVEQNSASKQVLEALRDINSATTEVQSSSKSMKQNSKKVNKEIETLANLSRAISGSMDEMGSGAVAINDAARGVSDMAEQTRANIREVEGLIGKFRV